LQSLNHNGSVSCFDARVRFDVEVFILGNSLLVRITQEVFCVVFEAFADNEGKMVAKLEESESETQMSIG
jgi:hypothetical protein